MGLGVGVGLGLGLGCHLVARVDGYSVQEVAGDGGAQALWQ